MQQWIKAPLDFFWNRIGKKENTQRSLDGAIELRSPRMGKLWFLTARGYVVCVSSPPPRTLLCLKDRRLPLPLLPRVPQVNL